MTARIRLFVWLFCLSVFAGVSYWSAVRVGAQSPGPQLRQIAYLKASNSEGADHFACGGSLPGHTGHLGERDLGVEGLGLHHQAPWSGHAGLPARPRHSTQLFTTRVASASRVRSEETANAAENWYSL